MATVILENVGQVMSRQVKPDGRCGGLQSFAGRSVDIIVYDEEEVK